MDAYEFEVIRKHLERQSEALETIAQILATEYRAKYDNIEQLELTDAKNEPVKSI